MQSDSLNQLLNEQKIDRQAWEVIFAFYYRMKEFNKLKEFIAQKKH